MKIALQILATMLCLGQVAAQQPLFLPDTLSGTNIQLQLQQGTTQFFPGQATQTMGANGIFLAPTLLLDRGQQVNMQVHNQLSDTTTLHWHGLHVSPSNDGGPHIYILPGQSWNPSFTVLDWASTYWYHPHLHHKTARHVANGIAGLIIVRDSVEAALSLPRTYGLDDIPVILQTRQFDANNQIVIDDHLDTSLTVNGTRNPFVQLPAQLVRLRLLNGAIDRAFNIGLSTNESFMMIGSDGGLLSAPVPLTRLQLAPGERAEIIVNLVNKQGQSLHLMNYGAQLPNGVYGAAQPGMGMGQQLPGYSLNPLNGANFNLLQIQVGPQTDLPVLSISDPLVVHTPFVASQADTTRMLTFMAANMGPTAIQGPFMINNAHFDMNVINQRIPFNNIEVWQLVNQSPIGHPFHLHDVPFYVLSINGAVPPAHLRGRKDVVFVPAMGNVTFITQFETFWDDSLPYMYHCHMLTHEEHGMMGQFLVTSPFGTSVQKLAAAGKELRIYPNPAAEFVYLEVDDVAQAAKLYIRDMQGRIVAHQQLPDARNRIAIHDLAPGVYALQVVQGAAVFQARLVKQGS